MALEKTKGYTSGAGFAAEVLGALKKSGISLKEEASLVFYLYLPSKAAARDAGIRLRVVGLTSGVERSASGSLKWLCLGKRKLVPERKVLGAIGALLIKLAKEHKGQFDGWETELPAIAFDFEAILAKLLKK